MEEIFPQTGGMEWGVVWGWFKCITFIVDFISYYYIRHRSRRLGIPALGQRGCRTNWTIIWFRDALATLGLPRLKWRLLWVLEMKLVDSANDATRNAPSCLWADELILGWNLELCTKSASTWRQSQNRTRSLWCNPQGVFHSWFDSADHFSTFLLMSNELLLKLRWVGFLSSPQSSMLETSSVSCSSPATSTGTRAFIHLLTHSFSHIFECPDLGSTNTGRPLCCVSDMSVVRDRSSYQDMQWLQTGWRDRRLGSRSFKSQGQELPLSCGDTDVKNGTRSKRERKAFQAEKTSTKVLRLDGRKEVSEQHL